MSTISCSSLLLVGFCFCFLFLFYGPGHWTDDVNNASGFRVERGMFWECFFAHAWEMASYATRRSLR
jgi:heme/copper-type cytochrome/quinol oxidase subunit 3